MNTLHRFGLFLSYIVSSNGTSPVKVMCWIVVTILAFIAISCLSGHSPLEGAWFFLNMGHPEDDADIIYSILAIADGLVGLILTADFVSVVNSSKV